MTSLWQTGDEVSRGTHVEHLTQHWQLVPGVAQALGWFRFLEIGEEFPDFAKRVGGRFAHAERDAFWGAKEVGKHGHRPALRACLRGFEQQRRALRAQHAIGDLGHLESGRYRRTDATQFALALELGDEVTEIGILHGRVLSVGRQSGFSHRHCRKRRMAIHRPVPANA